MNKIKAYFVVGTIMFLLLIPFKCFSQNSITPEQAKELRETLVIEAKKYVGSPYIRGATGPNSFDCSGLVFYVARESIQFQLPRTVKAMYGFVKIIPDEETAIAIGKLYLERYTSGSVEYENSDKVVYLKAYRQDTLWHIYQTFYYKDGRGWAGSIDSCSIKINAENGEVVYIDITSNLPK